MARASSSQQNGNRSGHPSLPLTARGSSFEVVMQDRIFGERQKALEGAYFREQDAKLVEHLRQKARLDDIAVALGEKLQVDDPDLLLKVKDLGVTLATAPALFFAPMVQVAWAEGKVSKGEREAVLRIARRRGVEADSSAYAQLEEWLRSRPSHALFEVALEVLKFGYAVLPAAEREERMADIVHACHEVAEASSPALARLLRLVGGVSPEEAVTLDDIARSLRRRE
jgi:hypothetical protein